MRSSESYGNARSLYQPCGYCSAQIYTKSPHESVQYRKIMLAYICRFLKTLDMKINCGVFSCGGLQNRLTNLAYLSVPITRRQDYT